MLRLTKNLEPLRAAAEKEIDTVAEGVRGLFITSGSGQSMVYTQKEKEAELVTADANVSAAEIPHIVLEAQMNGISLLDQAAIVLTMAHQWRELSSRIEVARLAGKGQVRVAQTPAAIQQSCTDTKEVLTGVATGFGLAYNGQ
ncbi:hypothetical protein HJA82_29130 [Rhizobium bangladeshense]|uniref:hypothetical protein n=1 Tax=Rhizobium bangladeshense TaxID=1138189 RepID=UPI001C82E85D|nr:hypothetical protein [Rhizobium bangladeshense]MBX4911378.1 hypothetical protein [Rhizobium bangladeshense]